MDTQIKKEEADNEEKDRSAEVQKFIGPSKGHCSIWTCDQAFQHLLSSKAKRQQGHQRQQKTRRRRRLLQKHWRCQSWVWWCPHNLEALKEKVKFLGTKTVERVVPRHLELLRKMATNKVKHACHEAANVLRVMKLTLLLWQLLRRYIEGCFAPPSLSQWLLTNQPTCLWQIFEWLHSHERMDPSICHQLLNGFPMFW